MAEQNVTAIVMCLMVNFKWPRNMGGGGFVFTFLSHLHLMYAAVFRKRINGFLVMRHPNYHS